MNNSQHFSSGELAKLAGVSKQILRYYEKNDILMPDFIDDNGYRYYKPETYFTLEVIISMRKLDIPLKSIKKFLENRNKETLKTFYLEHINKLEKIKNQAVAYQDIFEHRLRRLEELVNIPLNTVMVVPTISYDIVVSDDIPLALPQKQRLTALANFLRPLLLQEEYTNYLLGYMVHYDDLFNQSNKGHFHAIFPAYGLNDNKLGSLHHIEGGLCLSVVFKDDHGRVPSQTTKILQEYIELNNMRVVGDVFVYAVGDHWCSKTWDDVLCRLYVHIEYKK